MFLALQTFHSPDSKQAFGFSETHVEQTVLIPFSDHKNLNYLPYYIIIGFCIYATALLVKI